MTRAGRALVALAALLTAGGVTTVPTAQAGPLPSAAAPSVTVDGTVRLTGTVLRTPAEPGQPERTGLHVGGRVVEADGAGIDEVPAGSTVTVDAAVPAGVTRTPRGTVAAATRRSSDGLQVDRVVSHTAPSPRRYTPATRKIVLVNVTPKGVTREPRTTSSLAEQVSAASTYWQDNSRGELSLAMDGTVRPEYESAYTCTKPFQLWDEAVQKYGVDVTADNVTLALVLPPDAEGHGCAYGLGTVGTDPNSGGYLYFTGDSPDVLSHEIGHNMSLEHANRLQCSTSDGARTGRDFYSGCSIWEYGDGQDIMGLDDVGRPSAMLSAPQALRNGMLEPSARTAVGAGTTRVTLLPLAGRTGLRVATVRDASSGATYYVEYRTKAGKDAYNAWDQHTGVRVLRSVPGEGTLLLDPTPSGKWVEESDIDPTLHPGASITSYTGSVRITTVWTSSSRAVVEIRSTMPAVKNLSRPTITGSRGVGHTLTATKGTWSATPSAYYYRWYRGGAQIPGATGSTYRATTTDAGRYLSVRVSVSAPGHSAGRATSSRVGIPIHSTRRPTIGGAARSGNALTAYVGSWTPQPSSYAYQWYRGGSRISGATSKTYRLTTTDVGSTVKVRVTARRTGYSSGYAYSPTTSKVAR